MPGNLPIGDANAIVQEMGQEQILPLVRSAPRSWRAFMGWTPPATCAAFWRGWPDIGYSGVINFPTVGKLSGPIRQELEQVGLGFSREVQRLHLAAELGFFTMAYCYCPQEARMLAEAGVDIIVSHVGLTAGGDVGVRTASPLEEAAERTRAILEAALEVRPDIIPLCHGGPIVTPQDVQKVIQAHACRGLCGCLQH